jgi:hypothetical protein
MFCVLSFCVLSRAEWRGLCSENRAQRGLYPGKRRSRGIKIFENRRARGSCRSGARRQPRTVPIAAPEKSGTLLLLPPSFPLLFIYYSPFLFSENTL